MTRISVLLLALILALTAFAGSSNRKETTTVTPAVHADDAATMRTLGEQRFRANCGRCHAAPQKFPPRAMSTVIRHMRVRATITDEDMRLVLFYMTQ
jgi:mono/diheme cytochrome c family protein